MAERTRTGGCACGAVEIFSEGEPKWVALCHCRSCRRGTGAPVSAYAGFDAAKVAITGPARAYASSAGVTRRFCETCGTPISYEGERWPGEIHLHLGALDGAEALQPTAQGFREEKLPWLDMRLPG